MSIQSEINRIKGVIEGSYPVIKTKGGTIPSILNSENLISAIESIPVGGSSNYSISITFDSAFSGQPYTVSGPEEEIHTGIVPDSLQKTVQVYHGGSQYIITSTDTEGIEYKTSVLVGPLFGSYDVILKMVRIYGATWNGTATTKWTRTDDAKDFIDPNPYVAGATEYGSPFDNLQPWAGMTIEERTGGTMVKIPKFWYQLYQNTEGVPSSGMTIRIANEPLEGFQVSPAHMDRGDGHGERDFVYVGRYHCAMSDYKSKTGERPKDYITRATARTAIHNLGENIWQIDFATRFTILLLYLVEFADWNSQECIGYGCGNNKNTENMGYTDSMPYHTGTMKTSKTAYGVGTQYRNIEGIWDNIWEWTDGGYNNSNGFNIILNPNNFNENSGGTVVGIPTRDYPSEFTVKTVLNMKMFLPSKTGGSANTYSCDYWTFISEYANITAGGSYTNDQISGIFFVSCSEGEKPRIGARSIELPN